MKQRRIFAQLVNQWQEEAKEDFKAQKMRLGMQKSGLQRTLLGYSAQRNAKKSKKQGKRRLQRTQTCPALKIRVAARPKRAQRLDTHCSAPKGPRNVSYACSAPKGAAAHLSPLRVKSIFQKCAPQRVFTRAAARD
ncbi:hypothetical protein L484_025893 [Morus notabilis]|uniref:Uncharacterized protein n=1 Tax=Morus notabilis TaxID=981085 RepID=W9R2L0_9ROSA|nr:hypothetical protein L484_025893 [Morus notabilis]